MSFEKTIGSRAEVWHGTSKHTSGGLTKSDLFKNKAGRIVSKKKHHTAKKDNRLVKSGYGTKKGKFGYVKIGTKKNRTKGKKGGSPYGNSLSPMGIDGQGITSYPHNSTDVQIAAGMAGGKRHMYGGKRHMYGGKGYGNSLSPAGIDGQGITSYPHNSTDVQIAAGMAGGKRRKHGGTTRPVNSTLVTPVNANPLSRAMHA
jgi:hypothetical protein